MAERTHGLIAALLLLALSGCASLPEPDPVDENLSQEVPASWNKARHRLEGLSHWTLTGKIAVRQEGDNESAVINQWKQAGDRFQITLSSPFLGLGTTRIQGSAHQFWLTESDGQTYYAEDPSALMDESLGWRLPLGAMGYWVRGMPAPDAAEARLWFDTGERLAVFRQSGWEITINRRRPFFSEELPLPSLLTLRRPGVRIRLAITQWTPDRGSLTTR